MNLSTSIRGSTNSEVFESGTIDGNRKNYKLSCTYYISYYYIFGSTEVY